MIEYHKEYRCFEVTFTNQLGMELSESPALYIMSDTDADYCTILGVIHDINADLQERYNKLDNISGIIITGIRELPFSGFYQEK